MSEKKYPTIYSIDFDGTIVEKGKFPEFGRPVEKVVDYIREIQKRGDDWILNTNREGKDLEMAVTWLKENGLNPSCVNDNLPRMKEFFGTNPRKIFANVVIDDLNAGGIYLPPMDGTMDFGQAIRELKNGKKISRLGWHGRGQFIFMADTVEFHTFANLADSQDVSEVHDMIVLKTSANTFQPGWIAKQADILAEDWVIVQ